MSEAEAIQCITKARWPEGPNCPKCGTRASLRPGGVAGAPSDGALASPGKAALSPPHCFCAICRKRYPLLWNTPLAGTRIPLHHWLEALDGVCESPRGKSAREISASLHITRKSASLMLARIYSARSAPPLLSRWRGALQALHRGTLDSTLSSKTANTRRHAKALLEVLERAKSASAPGIATWKWASAEREFRLSLWPLSSDQVLVDLLHSPKNDSFGVADTDQMD